jgi:hypothetical protein
MIERDHPCQATRQTGPVATRGTGPLAKLRGKSTPECTNLCIAAHTCFQCKEVLPAIETVKKEARRL